MDNLPPQRQTPELGESLAPPDLSSLTKREFSLALARHSHRVFGHDAFLFCFRDVGRDTLIPVYGEDTFEGETEPRECMIDEVVRGPINLSPRLTNRETLPEKTPFAPLGDEGRLSRSLMFTPIRHQGMVVGSLSVQSYTPHRYEQDALERLNRLAEEIAPSVGALLAHEQRLKMAHALEKSSTMVFVTDERGRIDYANDALLRNAGLRFEELWGKLPEVLLGPGAASYAAAEGEWSGEAMLTRPGHEAMRVALRRVPIAEDGEPATHHLYLAEDLTEKHETEEKLRRRDAILEAVAFAAQRFLRADDWEQDVTAFLEQLGRAAGVTRCMVYENTAGNDGDVRSTFRWEWMDGEPMPGSVDPRYTGLSFEQVGLRRWVHQMSKGGEIAGHCEEFPGEERNFLESHGVKSLVAVPIMVRTSWWGTIALNESRWHRKWSHTEIESLKAAAAVLGAALERRQTEQALRESERIMRLLLDASPMISLLLSRDGTVLAANELLARATGVPLEKLIGRDASSYLPTELAEARRSKLEQAIAAKEPIYYTDEVNDRIYHSVLTPILDARGEVARVCIFAQDITELRRNERLASLGMTTAGLAHHIKNLQMALSGSMYLMETTLGREDYKGAERAWPVIRRSIRRINLLISDILGLGRDFAMHREHIDLNSIVREAIEECDETASDCGVELKVRLDESIPKVWLNAAAIYDVVLNLVGNGVDAARNSSQANRFVKVTTRRAAGRAVIEVRDNGCGMQPEVIERVFEPFFTTKGSKGTGLGLALVKRTLEEMDGSISLESTPGEGSCFSVELPLNVAQPGNK